MSKTYCILGYEPSQSLYEKLGGEQVRLLASHYEGVWTLHSIRPRHRLISEVECKDVTKEEAAMILFQCGEPA